MTGVPGICRRVLVFAALCSSSLLANLFAIDASARSMVEGDNLTEAQNVQLLQSCQNRLDLHVQVLVDLVDIVSNGPICPGISKIKNDLQTCQEQERQNRKSLRRLNAGLETCQMTFVSKEEWEALNDRFDTARQDLDLTRQERNDIQLKLSDAQNRVKALEQRLAFMGITPEPGFAYMGTPQDSVVKQNRAAALVAPELRLPRERCADALDWLDSLEAEERPLLKHIWVWEMQQDPPLLCTPTSDGGTLIIEGSRQEAHLVIFR